MNNIKERIKKNFTRASVSYDSVADLQQKIAALLVTQLRTFVPDFCPQSVLDLGTGTGIVPALLLPFYSKASYVLNDIASTMLEQASKKFQDVKNVKYLLADMEELSFDDYDLIISNFSFQWADNLESLLEKCFLHSKVMAFSCLLEDTFMEWDALLKEHGVILPRRSYPQEISLMKFLRKQSSKKNNFKIINHQVAFLSIREFIHYLKNLGAQTASDCIPLSVMKKLIKTNEAPITITYKIFIGLIKNT
jgi:malonyl-CoA O-methyltransferase